MAGGRAVGTAVMGPASPSRPVASRTTVTPPGAVDVFTAQTGGRHPPRVEKPKRMVVPVGYEHDIVSDKRTASNNALHRHGANARFDVIAFDGDDTLWHNERSYHAGRERFRQMLARAGVRLSGDAIERRVTRTEVDNIAYYGYGVSSFVLSLIQTAIELSRGRIAGRDLACLIDLARDMVSEHVEVFDEVPAVLAQLSQTHPLMLITKGDLLHQRSKLERSGLERYFTYVEVVSHKTPAVYRTIWHRHRIEPSRFLMVGNAMRSDVLPVVAAGGWAVYVPSDLSWSHEHAVATVVERRRFVEVTRLSAVLDLVHGRNGGASRARNGRVTARSAKSVQLARASRSPRTPTTRRVRPGARRRR